MGEILLCFGFSGVSLIIAIVIYLSLKREFKAGESSCEKAGDDK